MLNFTSNPSFPELSSSVTVAQNKRRGRHVKAVENIPEGEMVCLETGTVVSIDPSKCSYCLDDIDQTMECCMLCLTRHEQVHPWEAPFYDELEQLGLAKLAVRVLLTYSAEDIVNVMTNKSLSVSVPSSLRSSEFKSVMSLVRGHPIDMSPIEDFVRRFAASLQKHPIWGPAGEKVFCRTFNDVSQRLTVNAHTIYSVSKSISRSDDSLPCGSGLFPISSIFNHSCKANVFSFFDGNRFVFVSKGIKKNEELVDNYGIQYVNATRDQRQEFLKGRGFLCTCNVCVEGLDDLKESIELPPDYEEIRLDIASIEDARSRCVLPLDHLHWEELLDQLDYTQLAPNDKLKCSRIKLGCQRERGLINEPEQAMIYLRMMTSVDPQSDEFSYDRFTHWLACCLLKLRMFYKTRHPAYKIVEELDELLKSDHPSMKDRLQLLSDPLGRLKILVESWC